MTARWIAICSKPNKEEALYRKLQADGYEIFFPRYQSVLDGLNVIKIKPYFPGYLFVRVDLDLVGISNFQWMPFAVGPVYCGGKPACIPDRLIAAIQKRVNQINKSVNLSAKESDLDEQVDVQKYEAILDVNLSTEERIGALLQAIQQESSLN